MTNRDRFIQNLSNEELAYMLGYYCELKDNCRECELIEVEGCAVRSQVVQWLESEVAND